ncbi:3399_t:CDS:2, partial [Racocetra persica]
DFEGGELCFPQLQIVVKLKPGQVVAFSSRLLLHVYNDLEEGIERNARGSIVSIIPRQDLNNAQGLNRQTRLLNPKANQIKIPPLSSD